MNSGQQLRNPHYEISLNLCDRLWTDPASRFGESIGGKKKDEKSVVRALKPFYVDAHTDSSA